MQEHFLHVALMQALQACFPASKSKVMEWQEKKVLVCREGSGGGIMVGGRTVEVDIAQVM